MCNQSWSKEIDDLINFLERVIFSQIVLIIRDYVEDKGTMYVITLVLCMSVAMGALDTNKSIGYAVGASVLGGYISRGMAPMHECKKFPIHMDPITRYTVESWNHFDNKITRFKWSLNGAIGAGIIAYLILSNRYASSTSNNALE